MQRGRRFDFPLATPLALVVVTVTALVAAAFPLTGSPGPEAAQLLSAVGGPAFLIAGAARGSKRHDRGFFGDVLNQLLVVALGMLAFVAIVTVAGWGNPSCAPGRGYLPFVFLSFPVLCLGSALGLWIGRLTGGHKRAVLAAVLFLVAYAVWVATDWYVDPSFRVLTHLFVLVEGDLFAGRDVSASGVAYRMATLLFAAGLGAWGMATFPRSKGAPGLGNGVGAPPALLAVGILSLVLGGVVHLQAKDALEPNRGDLEEAYSLTKKRGSLVVHADPSVTTVREVDAMLAEGALWLSRLEQRMGATPDEDIHVFLHRDAAAMGRWTGAENVHFALPSKNEVHISGIYVPHPTLGHELAHILGRQLANNFLGVPTSFGLPNTGLIEGLAMAMTPELEVSFGLTLREQAAALYQAELAPPLNAVFDENFSFFRFWTYAPRNAYVVAGALIEALAATTGRDGLAKVYRDGSLRAAFDSDVALAAFVADHEESLRRMELPSDAIPRVVRSFSRPSILAEACDPAARLTADAVRAAAHGGDFDTAERLAAEAEGELTSGTLLALARAAHDVSQPARAIEYLLRRAEAADADTSRERALRLDAAGNALWRAGRYREAAASWARIDESTLPPHRQREVIAKELLAEAAIARPADRALATSTLDFLVDARESRGGSAAHIALIARLIGQADARGNGNGRGGESQEVLALARYVLVLQLVQRGHLDEGLELALAVWEQREALPRAFEPSLLNAIAMAHARRGDVGIARVAFQSLADSHERADARVLMNDRAERLERMMNAEESDLERAGDRWLLGLERAGPL